MYFKVELPTNGLQDTSYLVIKSIQIRKKLLRGHRVFLSYLGLRFSQFTPRRGKLFYIRMGK